MKLSTKKLVRTALLLALCVASQFLKNTSVYITGSIVNAILILATLSCGLWSGVIISLIAPITSWLITGSPLISAMPVLLPCIMLGNLILVFATALSRRFTAKGSLPLCLAGGSCVKGLVMYLTIVVAVLPLLGPATGLPEKALIAARLTFSVTQLITALIGSLLAYLIWWRLKDILREP